MPSGSRSYISVAVEVTLVWQLVEATASAHKICHFVGLKKRKVTAIVCVFYEKRRLKNEARKIFYKQNFRPSKFFWVVQIMKEYSHLEIFKPS